MFFWGNISTKFITKIISTFILALAVLFSAGSTTLAFEASQSSVDSLIRGYIQEENLPGLAVVITRGEEIVYIDGYGVASINTGAPVTPQTIFDLASVTKSFTAVGVLLLWDKGLIDLDRPVQYYLSDFKLNNADDTAKITVRQLLNQTSGLSPVSTEPLTYYDGNDAMSEMLAGLGEVRLNNTPGETFEYTNLNYAILGALVEEVSGMPFEAYMQQAVLDPLGLTNTTFYPEIAAQKDRATGHQLFFGNIVARDSKVYRSGSSVGWAMSCVEDLGKWLMLNINGGRLGGEQLIPERVIEEVQKAGVFFELDEMEVGYGMGWFSGEVADSVDALWHGGDTLSFLAEMIIVPEEELGVVVLVNSQNSSAAHHIAADILSIILSEDVVLPSAPWWASWQSIDKIAVATAAVVGLLALALVYYVWWLWAQVRRYRDSLPQFSRGFALRPIVLRVLPMVLLGMAGTVLYFFAQNFFGFNLFTIMIKFGTLSPPGIWTAGLMVIGIIVVWVLVLAALSPLQSYIRKAKSIEAGELS